MRAKLINEKFSEGGDPVHDLGIGEVEYSKLQQTYRQLEEYMEFDMEDITFSNVIETLDYLRRIAAYNVSAYFNRKYSFNIRIDPKNTMGGVFAKGSFGKYDIKFSTSGPGKMVYVGIYQKGDDEAISIKQVTKNYGYAGSSTYQHDIRAEGSSRTIHGLHNKLLYFCKVLKIDLTPYKI